MTSKAVKTGSRLRKDRNVFKRWQPPAERMSRPRYFKTLDSSAPLDESLKPIRDFFTTTDQARERFAWALRDSLDEVLDGRRTGRWCYQHLTKTEKTYLGTAVEVNFTKEFDLDSDTTHNTLDWEIDGIEVDCKFSKDFGAWEIPMEMYLCHDHGDQSGTADHPALLLWMDDDQSQWAAGLVRITDEILAFKSSGDRAYNRDNKRKLSKNGLNKIHWLWGGLQEDLPPNLIRHLPSTKRDLIFKDGKSGQARVNSLLRECQQTLITRATVLTVAQQEDSMKRPRDARLNNHLGNEGFIILGHQEADPTIARLLGLPIPAKGEFVSCRLVNVEAESERQKVFLDGAWWAIARSGEHSNRPAPQRKKFKKHTDQQIESGIH